MKTAILAFIIVTLASTVATATEEQTARKPQTEAEKAFAQIENPQSVKDYFVNNLLTAAGKVGQEYNGTTRQQLELMDILQAQAFYSKKNIGFAFFGDGFSAALEVNLKNKDSQSLKTNRKMILNILPEIHNFPSDQKVALDFTLIVTKSLDASIRSRAAQMGIVDTSQNKQKP